jgi:predicted glycoside hydrolase/deacetylase ChbG (UPF0249 family)
MKNLILVAACLSCMYVPGNSQTLTTQEKLGYSRDAKLVIIHADDLGVSHSENMASTAAMENGSVSSASIMVPTPWFTEIATYARSHPKADLGLHLTLTSEWKNYKWRSLADNVPGLNNREGFLFASVDSVYKSASLAEIEKELRTQIEKAKQFGIDVTHLDSHMGTLFGNPDYLKIYIRLGREYKLPVMIPKQVTGMLGSFLNDKDVVVDDIQTASPENFKNGMETYYKGVLNGLKPGLNVIIIHTAYNDKEMQSVTVDHPDWGAAWRQADYDFFTSETCKRILKDQGIHVVTWREVRDKLIRP